MRVFIHDNPWLDLKVGPHHLLQGEYEPPNTRRKRLQRQLVHVIEEIHGLASVFTRILKKKKG
jgi:hypothetical protein